MKKIEAIVKPYKIEDIKNELVKIGIVGMTISNVEGFGTQGGHKEYYRDAEYNVAFVPKIKIEIVLSKENLEKAIETIMFHAHTGDIGDGKIFVYDVVDVIKIRTGQRGKLAL